MRGNGLKRSRARNHWTAAVVVGLLSLLIAAPAFAANDADGANLPTAVRQPDAWVRYYSFKSYFGTYVDPRAWKGKNIYNTTGVNQTVKDTAAGTYEPGDHYIYQVTIQNDGQGSDRFSLKATGQGNWTTRYFRGTNNITSAVVAGTYNTPSLAAGEKFVIKVKLYIGNAGTNVTRLITATSVANGNRKDAVRIRAEYVGCGC